MDINNSDYEFYKSFSEYLFSKGFNWNKNCFIKYENEILIRVYCNNINNHIIIAPTPLCSSHEFNQFNLSSFAVQINTVINSKWADKNAVKNLSNKDYLNVFKEYYEKYFSYTCLLDYVRKITSLIEIMCTRDYFDSKADILLNYNYINFYNLALVWYKTEKIKECKEYVLRMLNVQSSLLYNIIQKINLTNNDTKIINYKKIYLTLVSDYKKLSEFAEALFEDNKEYFIQINKSLSKNEKINAKLIKSL